jgi:hypothetical protein
MRTINQKHSNIRVMEAIPIRLPQEHPQHRFVSSSFLIRRTSSINHNDCSHFLFYVIVSFNPFRTHRCLTACLCAADGADGAFARRHGRTRAIPGADFLCLYCSCYVAQMLSCVLTAVDGR